MVHGGNTLTSFHVKLSRKAILDRLDSVSEDASHVSSIFGICQSDAEFFLQPILIALDSGYGKVVEPALECAFKLVLLGLVRDEVEVENDHSKNSSAVVYKLIESTCKACGIGEELIELAVLRVVLAAIRGDCLLLIVRTCYNVYFGGSNGTNQICAKSVLAQIMVIVFLRVEEDYMDVGSIKTISVSELFEFADKSLNEGSSIHFAQNLINEVTGASEGVADVEQFKNICKFSMKFSSQENLNDRILVMGKILSLELLKVIMANAGPVWLSNERYLQDCQWPFENCSGTNSWFNLNFVSGSGYYFSI